MITGFEKIFLVVLLFVLMMGMGATLSVSQFKDVLQRPKGIIIGLLSQFGWMPLIGLLLAKVFALPDVLAIGLILIACTPGGTTSNLFAYFIRSDVALSISMTVVSSIVAVGVMPLLVWAYTLSFTSAELEVPVKSIVSTLLIMLIPLCIGMFIRSKNKTVAKNIETLGSWSGIAVLILLIVSSVLKNAEAFLDISMNMFLAALLLGLVGMAMGFVTSKALKLPKSQRRAVMFETGIQNTPLAIGVVLASFSSAIASEMIKMPLLYALLVVISASGLTFAFKDR